MPVGEEFAAVDADYYDNIYLAVRRKKTTIYLETKETASVAELKKMIEGITKVAPEDQKLYNWKNEPLDEKKNLINNGYNWCSSSASCHAEVKVAFKNPDKEFEALDVVNYSPAPELPDVMKASQQETPHVSGEAQTA